MTSTKHATPVMPTTQRTRTAQVAASGVMVTASWWRYRLGWALVGFDLDSPQECCWTTVPFDEVSPSCDRWGGQVMATYRTRQDADAAHLRLSDTGAL